MSRRIQEPKALSARTVGRTGLGRVPDSLLLETFKQSLVAVTPQRTVPGALPPRPRGRTIVVGAGKASASMAQVVEKHWAGELSGMVVVPRGYALPCSHVTIVEAAHPVPDEIGMAAARQIMELVSGLTEDDLVIAMFSGGGSALLPLPGDSVTLQDKKAMIEQLLRAGAPISDMNCLRKHLSAIKGGRLARVAAPAAVANILISDVPGDDPSLIASGPTVPDPSTLEQAREVAARYGLRLSDQVRKYLAVEKNETPKPDDPCFARVSTRVVATPSMALEEAARFLQGKGLRAHVLGDRVEGESRQLAQAHATLAHEILSGRGSFSPPCVLLSGGETTVTVRGEGKGGPNMEYLLALITILGDTRPFAAIACDTDGSDGSTGVAGAIMRPDTAARAIASGLHADQALENNDSQSFFAALGDLVVTGPTFNNVNDFRALFISDFRRRETIHAGEEAAPLSGPQSP